jgi:hypothetical protein
MAPAPSNGAHVQEFVEPLRPLPRALAWRAFWRALPWTGGVVAVYVTQLVTSILMGGEWNTALVALQAIVVGAFVAVFYALAIAKEKENVSP